MSGEWCRVGDAARALGVSPATVRRLIDRGKLDARRYPAEDGPTWYLVSTPSVARLARLARSGPQPDTLRD